MLWSGLTYGGHALSCAAALACIQVYQEDNLIERAAEMGKFLAEEEDKLKAKHPCVGEVRHIGLFSIFELVKNPETREPMAPFNAKPEEMKVMNEIRKYCWTTACSRCSDGTTSSSTRRCASPKKS